MKSDGESNERYIPEPIKREVRKEALFGCVCCGIPIIEYHHIIPWSKVHKHEVANLIALCPTCHQKVHNNLISTQQLVSLKKLPFNRNTLIVKDKIYIHDMKCINLFLGGCEFSNIRTVVQISKKDIIFFEEDNDYLLFNALFYNRLGQIEAAVIKNEWFVFIKESTWDFRYSGGELKLRNNKNDIVLNMSINMEKRLIKITGEIYYENVKLIMKENSLDLVNLNTNSHLVFKNCGMSNCNVAISL